jgi:hypothetical protein
MQMKEGPMSVSLTHYERKAYALGVDAAKAAASWVIDGNTDAEHYRHVLSLMDNGDPRADDYLPATPNLSGEWAGDPTPHSLYEDVTGRSSSDRVFGAIIDAICDAWERGVEDTFQPECERLLRAAVES